MLELLSIVNFYNFAFYFGIFVLALAVLFGAWRSTYVPGLQNITVVVLQHPSGRQTVERFTSTRRTSTTEEEVGLQDEVYEEITLTAEDDVDEDDDQNEEDSGVEIAILESSSPDQSDYNTAHVSHNSSISSGDLIAEAVDSGSIMDNNAASSSSNASHIQTNSLEIIDSTSVGSSVKDQHAAECLHNASGESHSSAVSAECSTSHSSDNIDKLNSKSTPSPKWKTLNSDSAEHSENGSNTLQTDCTTSLHATKEEDCAELRDEVSAGLVSTSRPGEPELPVRCSEHESEGSSTKEPSSQTDVPQEEESCPPGSIRIRLKYLDERQKTVFEQLTQNLIGFKRNHFNLELSEHRVIRLIFNGRLLKPDSSTLQECGLFDNCVVHCHVSQPKPPPPPSQLPAGEEAAGGSAQQQRRPRGGRRRWLHFLWHASVPDALHDDHAAEGLDLSNYMSALLWLVVAGLWFMRFKHSYMFSTFSTFMLIFLTMLLIVPHYIFSVDVQLSVNLDGNTMRNLGIDRVVVLERLRGRRESSARRGHVEDDGTGTSPQNSAPDDNSGSVAPSAARDGSAPTSTGDPVIEGLEVASGLVFGAGGDSR